LGTASLKRDDLQDAFEIFNRQSGMLEKSYQQLQHKVELLHRQLKQAQSERLAELVEKEKLSQHLSHLLETLPGAIVVIGGDGIIRESNSEATNLLNQPLIGCSWAMIVRREVRDGGSEDGNIQLRDGRWLSLSRRPLQQGAGEVLLLSDITESRQMSALRQRQERLTAIGEMTTKFAHEVRTPLASAMLYAAQLDRHTPQQQRVVQKITARLNDLGRMVNDMLGFAAGARRSQQTLKVRDLFSDVKLSLEAQLDEQTQLRLDVDDHDLRIAANGDALKGALLNLVTNAMQACGGGGAIELSARRSGDGVELSVSDNGPGVAPEALPRLFEPFFTTRPQGTGLGLAVVQAVAHAHDGEVSVATSASGTRFTMRLPAIASSSGHIGQREEGDE